MTLTEPSLLAGLDAWEAHLDRCAQAFSEAPTSDLALAIRRAKAMIDLGYLTMPEDAALGQQLLKEIAAVRGPSLACRMDPTLPRRRRGR